MTSSPRKNPDLVALEETLGYRFTNISLLERALTHRSREGQPSYERLEFLGDRVVGLVVADLLYTRFPNEDEGAMAQRHAHLVRQDTVARVAQTLGLGPRMRVARSEIELGAPSNPSLLCDVCEAVVGAIYRDGGFKAARRLILAHWTALVEEDPTPPRDPKTVLQEWAQARGLPLPAYEEEGREGPPHKPVFTVRVSVQSHGSESATGPSKRLAAQTAARLFLERLPRDHASRAD
ncbi:ribonuclease III [Pararhodospirillum oryzae]|uniref:Ribonuclease 3 n=1 Tax=Pararhodospirillum oryzae TaxID=478448 RepID=A0A512H6S2_9PROT|nr:ribonuclease III [Pararhodospirillum oryzae]GEO81131.1 ribonuclease 3 [Pararhodospirillum oryzae]